MSLRDWLILIGILLIIGVLAHGYHRMRQAKKHASSVNFGANHDDDLTFELPNGGARPIRVNSSERMEPSFQDNDDDSFWDGEVATARPTPQLGKPKTLPKDDIPSFASVATSVEPTPKPKPEVEVQKRETEKLKDRPPAQEVIVINIIAKQGVSFSGEPLMQALLANSMRFGDMAIFHRYSNSDGTGKILFSLANGLKPGTFDINRLEDEETTALSLFVSMPGPDNAMHAFTLMMETAKRLALELGGELRDGQMSVMTQQTIEHCRQRVQEYERKQLAKQPAV